MLPEPDQLHTFEPPIKEGDAEPYLPPERARKVEILIYDPNEDGIGKLVQDTAAYVGRRNSLVASNKRELIRFFKEIENGGSMLNLIVINSACVTRGKEAGMMDTAKLFKPGLDLANEILAGKVRDELGNEATVPWGTEMLFLAPRDQDRLEGAIKRATKPQESYVVTRLQALGLPPGPNDLMNFLNETAKYTIKVPRPSAEEDTI
jgi:hypothetical protein